MPNFGNFDADGYLLGVFTAETSEGLPAGVQELAEWQGWPNPPAPGQRLRIVGGVLAWNDPRPIDQVRDETWEAIKAERAVREAGTFSVGGRVYKIDQLNMVGAAVDAFFAQQLGEPFSQAWVLDDNSVAMLDAGEMIAAARACKAHISALWVTSQLLRAQIYDPALTAAQVAAIHWPG